MQSDIIERPDEQASAVQLRHFSYCFFILSPGHLEMAAVQDFSVVTLFVALSFSCVQSAQTPYFIHPCHRSDPNVNQCLVQAANHLSRNFKRGIPELGITEPEPILIDEISVALGSGPDGYRATFYDIEAYGVSNLTVTGVRSDLDTLQFQISFYIPKITARAHYKSSGVLIMVQSSGGGDYWGEYEGVKAKMYFRGKPHNVKGRSFMSIEELKLDFAVKEITMGIENLKHGNAVLQAALNLFINSNAQDLLTEMKPDIKKKMIYKMTNFINGIFSRVPYDLWLLD